MPEENQKDTNQSAESKPEAQDQQQQTEPKSQPQSDGQQPEQVQDQSTPVSQVMPHEDLNKSKIKSMVKPRGSGGKKSALVWTVSIVAGLLVALGGYVAYAYTLGPKMAVNNYLEKQSELTSGKYSGLLKGDVEAGSEGFASKSSFDIGFDGVFDVGEEGSEKGTFNIDGQFGSSGFNIDVKADVVVDNSEERVYFNVEEPSLVNLYAPGILGQWIYTDIKESSATGGSCTPKQYEEIGDLILADFEENLPIKDLRRASLLPVEVDGERAVHHRGEIDILALVEQLESLESEIEAICADAVSDSSEDFDESEAEDLKITFDLYTSGDFDKLVVNLTSEGDEKVDMTMEIATSEYGSDVEVNIPQDAKSLEEAMQQGLGANPFGVEGSLDSNSGSYDPNADFNNQFLQ